MKEKIFFLLLLIPIFLFSQNYQPVITDGAFWDVSAYNHDDLIDCSTPYRRYVIGDEITINGMIYKQLKVYDINGIDTGEPCEEPPFIVSSNYYIDDVYVREDITEKKVYILSNRYLQDYQEFTLCDFNLEVGDILVNGYEVGDVEISAIQVYNGVKHYFIDGTNYSYAEGIGGIGGIVAPLIQFEYFDYLACYGNIETNENNCSAFVGIDDYLLAHVNLFPNPAKNTIQVKTAIYLDVTIYNVLGKKVIYHANILNDELNISHLVRGVYFVKLEDRISNTEKILKIIKE